MKANKKDYKAFAKEYKKKEQEILVLFSDQSGGAGKVGANLWSASAYFLAYQNAKTGEVKNSNGCITWPITEEELRQHGSAYPYFFKKGGIYRLRVRDLLDRTVPEGRLPPFYNRFWVTRVLEENAQSGALAALLKANQAPVVVKDEALGNFTLNKHHSHFEGSIVWAEKKVSVYLDVDSDNQAGWEEAFCKLRALHKQQGNTDSKFRRFAAAQLTASANDWLQEEDGDAITEEIFARRISLSELSMDASGNYTAYYNDDDMFYGHVVVVYGNVANGPQKANIEG